MNIEIKIENNKIEVKKTKFLKMVLLYNALESGWTVVKKDNSYVFKRKHEEMNEIFEEINLSAFMKDKFDLKEIIS